MPTLMLQFKHAGPAPSVDEVRKMFDLQADEIDPHFGVIATDPAQGLYTALVAVTATGRVQAVLATRHRDPAEGLFGNPRIEPFGPPER